MPGMLQLGHRGRGSCLLEPEGTGSWITGLGARHMGLASLGHRGAWDCSPWKNFSPTHDSCLGGLEDPSPLNVDRSRWINTLLCS